MKMATDSKNKNHCQHPTTLPGPGRQPQVSQSNMQCDQGLGLEGGVEMEKTWSAFLEVEKSNRSRPISSPLTVLRGLL